jgi:CTP:molybdopterin cytidylyltransferase MocA
MVARAADADLVILAAGRSSRLGEPKGLVDVAGKPWLVHQLDAMARVACVRRVAVVLGLDAERYRAALPDLAGRALVVINPDPDRGPFSSLQCGLAALAGQAGQAGQTGQAGQPRPVFVLPVDVPASSPEVWDALARATAQASVPVHGGRGGHPVFLAPALVRSLLAQPPTSRLDHELARVEVARVPVADPRVGLNLNEPRDWGKLGSGTLG